MIEEIEQGMILYTQGNKIKHDVAHFLKVHQYARIIGKLEHLEKREQEILEVAAIVHDIACPMCREKYGNSAGYLQEQEGPVLVKDFLKNYSLDEAFMDISGLCGKYETLGAVGRAIKAEIKEKTGLVASAGIAPNKFLAKLASDLDKPDGLRIIPYGKEKEILAPLPVRRLWGVGNVTERKLRNAGFLTIGDIQKAPFAKLASVLGNQASLIQRLSFGVDDRAVEASRRIKSIGDESTYEKDLTEPADIDRQIAIHSDVVAKRLRRHKLAGRTISLKVRFASFRTVTRSLSLEEGTDLQEEIYAAALELKKRIYMNEGVRLIGVTASNLAPPLETVDLFSTVREKQAKAAAVMDAIQEKFGEHALRKGFWLEEEKRKEMEEKEKENKEAPEEE